MSHLRFKVIEEAYNRKAVHVQVPAERPEVYYAKAVFNRQKMFEYLSKDTYDALVFAIENKRPISRALADSVAVGMKRWAIDLSLIHI